MVSGISFSSNLGHFSPSLLLHTIRNRLFHNHSNSRLQNQNPLPSRLLVLSCTTHGENRGNAGKEVEISKYKWVRMSSNLTKEQHLAMSKLPAKMSNRCKALMKQILCFSSENGGSVPEMLAAWVKGTKPQRADWLAVLKELDRSKHSLYFEVAEHALIEESFEADIRDYTKIIHHYAKQNRIQEAEGALTAMKSRGFLCDQVILTALVHMYSKAGNLELAEDSFAEMKSLGVPLDKRSYGSMIMAYIRAGKLSHGESLLKEMEAQDIYAGREVYKALLRAYSMLGDSDGAQRIFNSIQLAGIVPDAKVCALLINAYVVSDKNHEAFVVLKNMRIAGLEPDDKCIALVLAAYEKENKLKEALDLLAEVEENGGAIGMEASDVIVKWFQKAGIVYEVANVLMDFGSRMPKAVRLCSQTVPGSHTQRV